MGCASDRVDCRSDEAAGGHKAMNGISSDHGADRAASVLARRSITIACLVLALTIGAGGKLAAQDAAAPTLDGQPPSGTVDLHEIQVAYIGNLGGGSGELTHEGTTYSFDVAGLGVGGIGISSVDAEGEVYKLTDLADFSGDYVSGQYGVVVGEASAGDMWLKNEHDVVLHLKAKREGLMLAVAADAIKIRLDE